MKSFKVQSHTDKYFWTPARIVLTCTVTGLLMILGLSSCNSADESKQNAPANVSVSRVPNSPSSSSSNAVRPPAGPVSLSPEIRDTKVQTLDGKSLKLSDYDNKVVVLNIWATWCGPCKLEMPELVKMNNDYKSRGLVVIGLATTYNEQQGEEYVKDFVRTKGINYKIVWDDGTLAAPLVQSVNARGVIPQSFVISRDGRIVKHFEGFSPLSTPALMRQAIEDALNDKSKA